MAHPYQGLRVVEVASDPAGELTGRLLAQMGADVVKVEPPEGAPSRYIGPFIGDVPDPERSLGFWYYNADKRSVVADLTTDEGQQRFDDLVSGADVLVSTLSPPELRRLGLDLDQLVADVPGLIVVSVTPFGLTGPWADRKTSDLVGLAASGLLITSGYDDRSIPPIRPGGDQGFHTAASFAHLAALLALLERQRTGQGGVVDVSMHEALAVSVELANPYWFYPRVLVQRQTCRHAQPTFTQPALFECADGRYVYFALILADQKPWATLVEWLASEGLAVDLEDEAYLDVAHRQSNFGHVQSIVEAFFLLKEADAAYHEGQARGLPIGILNAPEDLLDDEHLLARGFFVPVEHEGVGPVPYPGAPYRFSSMGPVPTRPAPCLGEHTKELLGQVATAPGSGASEDSDEAGGGGRR
jgi:crotonobetainyl-CoA:carnitine CoA-transferase CaiB-like acyl-CoA transferase